MLSEQTILKILADPEFDANVDISVGMDRIAVEVEWLDHPVVIKYALKDKNAVKWAYWYTRHVIEGRWPEGEEIIKKDSYWWEKYCLVCC